MGKNKTRSKSALKQNSVTAENKRLGDDGNINFTFKILSAIGIIIIVSGHCYNGGVSLMYDWFPKYSYNLALFVFISGYFYKEKHEEHIFKYMGTDKTLVDSSVSMEHCLRNNCIRTYSGRLYDCSGQI